jgi:hypothetical protein
MGLQIRRAGSRRTPNAIKVRPAEDAKSGPSGNVGGKVNAASGGSLWCGGSRSQAARALTRKKGVIGNQRPGAPVIPILTASSVPS